MSARTFSVTTRAGLTCQVRQYGSSGTPVVYLHGVSGLLADEPFLEALSLAEHTVFAPTWPGYGDEPGEEQLFDMQDFTLHAWDVIDAIELDRPHLIGIDLGGMIAAEMASTARRDLDRLVLIGPLGLWLDAHPIPDLFATLPFEFPQLLFADVTRGAALLSGGTTFDDPKAIEAFMIANSRRLGTAGKVLFPIPNRRLSKRIYRLTAPTLLAWGAQDRYVPTQPYSAEWSKHLPRATVALIEDAGHLVTLEQPAALSERIATFLAE